MATGRMRVYKNSTNSGLTCFLKKPHIHPHKGIRT